MVSAAVCQLTQACRNARLLNRALAILRDEHDLRTSDYVFPGGKAGKQLPTWR
jgi:hypothetical protein